MMMEDQPIEHRYYSRFIGPISREATYHWRAIMVLSLILLVGGIFAVSDPIYRTQGGKAVTLFFTILFGLAVLLTVMLRSFRKASTVLYPAVLAASLVPALAWLLKETISPLEGIYASIVLATAAGVNYSLVKKYIDERRKPATAMTSVFDSFSKLSKTVAGVYILETFTFLAIAAFTAEITGLLGIYVAAGLVAALMCTILVLPASLFLYEHTMSSRALTEKESKVLGYTRSFGAHKKHHPIVAGWLGIAVSEVETAVESLKAKGFLGSHFFAIDDPLVWFLLFGTYVLGALFSLTALPSAVSVWYDLGLAFLVTVGICLLSPQALQGIPKSLRRFLGVLIIGITLVLAVRTSVLLTEIIATLLVLGIISLYFGSSGAWLVGNVAVSIYFALIFLLGWLQFDTLSALPKLWTVGIGAVLFLMQMVMEEEAYITL